MVVAGVYFTHEKDDDWSKFGDKFNRENVREWLIHDIFLVELVKVFAHLKKEDVPDVMEEHFNATKKRSITSLTKLDNLNDDDVDAICKFREQIVQRKESSKVSKDNSMNVLVDIEDDSDLSIDDGVLLEKEKHDEYNSGDVISDDENNDLRERRN